MEETVYAKLESWKSMIHVWNKSTFALMGHKLDDGVWRWTWSGGQGVVPQALTSPHQIWRSWEFKEGGWVHDTVNYSHLERLTVLDILSVGVGKADWKVNIEFCFYSAGTGKRIDLQRAWVWQWEGSTGWSAVWTSLDGIVLRQYFWIWDSKVGNFIPI